MSLPNFIIVGAERCGTTSLYNNICKHSQVTPAYVKEIEHFDKHYDKGQEWYRKQFDGYSGEATPTYFWNPVVPQRIKALLPKCKIIITLREKHEAVWSKYWQQVSKGVEHLSFEEAL